MAQMQGAPLSRGTEGLIRDRLAIFERRIEVGRNELNEAEFDWVEFGRSWAALEEMGEQEATALGIEGVVEAVRLLVLDTSQARGITLKDRVLVLNAPWDLVARGRHARRGIFAFVAARRKLQEVDE